MAVIDITDSNGRLIRRLHNRAERRKYEKARGIKIAKAGGRPINLVKSTLPGPPRHVTSRRPR